MAWSTPSSVTTGDLITAATWNQNVVDNYQFLYNERILSITSIDSDSWYHATASTSFADAQHTFAWPGALIDTSILSIYYAAGGAVNNASAVGSAQLVTGIGSTVISSSLVGYSNNSGVISFVLSGDISADANLPSTNTFLLEQHKVNNASYNSRLGSSQILFVGA